MPPSVQQRYDVAVGSVRCVIFPAAYWTLTPPAPPAAVSELARIERQWSRARSDQQRAELALDAELLAQQVGPRNAIIETPGSIKAEMDSTLNVIEQLNRDIEGARVDDRFKAGWRAFRGEYQKFYKEHEGWTDRLWYSAYEKTVEYRQRALDWRRDFERLGGKATGPVDKPPPKSALEIDWKKAAAVGGGLLGLLIAARLVLGGK